MRRPDSVLLKSYIILEKPVRAVTLFGARGELTSEDSVNWVRVKLGLGLGLGLGHSSENGLPLFVTGGPGLWFLTFANGKIR